VNRIQSILLSLISLVLLISATQKKDILEVNSEQKCPQVDKNEIAQLFDRWNASLKTGKASEVVKNYAPNAILLPTVSNQVRHNRTEIRQYFEQFLNLQPVGTMKEENIKIFCDVAMPLATISDGIASGRYDINIRKNGKPQKVKARYTFVYQKIGNNWLIEEHHSSAMPDKKV
jgi:uncharacterized protein (TIGR02246 family)